MTQTEFNSLVLPLHGALYKVAFYILESQAEAEDAVQDLYIKLWSSRDKLDAVSNLKGYAITLMKNHCLDILRKASNKIQKVEIPPDEISPGQADTEMIAKEEIEKVQRAIAKLPKSQREVLQMKTIEGLTYEEIEKKTGMSNLTLRVLLSTARKTIKKTLGK